jgi:hypothetical protein
METDAAWYYLQDSRQVGPHTRSELEVLLERGVISAQTLVWRKNRSWEPMGTGSADPEPALSPPRRGWVLLLAVALFCGGLFYQVTTPRPSGTEDSSVMLAVPEIQAAVVQQRETPTLALEEERPRVPAASSQLVQEYWRAISYSKVIGRYEYYLRRSPSGSFAAAAAERIKELSSEALPEHPKVKRKKEATPSTSRPRPAKAQPRTNPPAIAKKIDKPAIAKKIDKPAIAKKIDKRCWSRDINECREQCRNGERQACHKLVRLGG